MRADGEVRIVLSPTTTACRDPLTLSAWMALSSGFAIDLDKGSWIRRRLHDEPKSLMKLIGILTMDH